MTFKETIKRELQIVIHGQSVRFRIIKYLILIALAWVLYLWRGGVMVGKVFLILAILGIAAHFFFRWKTKAWTESWGLYKVKE